MRWQITFPDNRGYRQTVVWASSDFEAERCLALAQQGNQWDDLRADRRAAQHWDPITR